MVSFGGIARTIFGSANERRIKSLGSQVARIGALEAELEGLVR